VSQEQEKQTGKCDGGGDGGGTARGPWEGSSLSPQRCSETATGFAFLCNRLLLDDSASENVQECLGAWEWNSLLSCFIGQFLFGDMHLASFLLL
jgi:hypothetical protein